MCARDPNGDRARVSRALAVPFTHLYSYLHIIRSGMGEILEKTLYFLPIDGAHNVTKTIKTLSR